MILNREILANTDSFHYDGVPWKGLAIQSLTTVRTANNFLSTEASSNHVTNDRLDKQIKC